jgi:hypothetical protein
MLELQCSIGDVAHIGTPNRLVQRATCRNLCLNDYAITVDGGLVIAITPPHMHWHVEVFVKTGIPPTSTVGFPGAQGAVVAGIHGCGVNTPKAAAVAAITCGLAGLTHTPKVGMFADGLKSMIVAAGCEQDITRGVGSATSVDGDDPSAHIMVAPLLTTEPAMGPGYSAVAAKSLV